MSRMKDLLIDAIDAGMIEPNPTFVDSATCPHPAQRLYTWRAYDDVMVVVCCDCGTVLRSVAKDDARKHEVLEGCRRGVDTRGVGDSLGTDQKLTESEIEELLTIFDSAVAAAAGV